MVETDIGKRWEEGIEHHPKSEEAITALAAMDFKYCDDYFGIKLGGDGDNGETMMYLLDIYFEEQDEEEKTKSSSIVGGLLIFGIFMTLIGLMFWR